MRRLGAAVLALATAAFATQIFRFTPNLLVVTLSLLAAFLGVCMIIDEWERR